MSTRDGGRLTLRAIEVFVAVVEEGSLASAAQRLGASPSSVFQQLTNLETALGARLIDRAARPFALTPAGAVFLKRALTILDEATGAMSELAEMALASLPRLRLAIVEDFDADVTPGLVAGLSHAMPDCAISVQSGPSHQNLAALETRAVDMVVVAEGEAALPDWIEAHPILREPYVLVTARGLAAGDDPLAALGTAPLVRYAPSLMMGQQIDAHLQRLRLSPARAFAFDSNHAVLATVAAVQGWAIATPLGFLSAPRLHDGLDLHPLPFAAFGRSLSLFARKGVMGALPGQVAARLREEIARRVLPAAAAAAPWLAGEVRIEGEVPGVTPLASARPGP
ncbi:MAG: LysR family transcriptional regulator [Pseudomonadota bacterium]